MSLFDSTSDRWWDCTLESTARKRRSHVPTYRRHRPGPARPSWWRTATAARAAAAGTRPARAPCWAPGYVSPARLSHLTYGWKHPPRMTILYLAICPLHSLELSRHIHWMLIYQTVLLSSDVNEMF